MAAKEVKLKDVEKELKDMTECCICLKVFDDPRMLPCIHTFCLKCLSETAAKLEKCVGDKLPCPLCRKEFVIPPDGVSALQKNFFIDKLSGMMQMLCSSMNRIVACDGCLADEVSGAPSAEVFCEDCSQHLCSSCLKQHMKFKATRNHTVVNGNLTEADDLPKFSLDNLQCFCGKHRNQELAIFCFDCRLVLCRLCFRESHSLHKGSSITREADKFRQEISNSAKDLSTYLDRFQSQRDQLKAETTDFLQTLQHVESEIVQTAEDMKELVDSDMRSLLAELKSIKEKRAKEAAAVDDELDLQLTILETHSNYCKYITEKGSPVDICQAVYDLKGKTEELKLLNPSPNEFHHRHLTVSFMKTGLKNCNRNIVGKITENTKSSTNLTHVHLEQTSTEAIRPPIPLSESIDPILFRTIQTKECRGITGFTMLNEKMYVASKDSSEFEVFDSINFEFICRWKLNGLEAPSDLTSCSRFRCIYIMDAKYTGLNSEILKVSRNGKLIRSWCVQDNSGCLSITQECNIIVAAYETHRICEYAPNGMLLREISLQFSGIHHPLHVLKLAHNQLLVSYGSVLDPEHGVCVIQADSDTTDPFITNAFCVGAGHSSDEIDVPIFLALDSIGDILVADCENNRVLLLSSGLQFKAQLLSYADGLRHPYRLHVDDTNNRLVVSDNDSCMDDGRILVYEINSIASDHRLSSSESFDTESENDF